MSCYCGIYFAILAQMFFLMKIFFEEHFSLDIFRQMEYIYPSTFLNKEPKGGDTLPYYRFIK